MNNSNKKKSSKIPTIQPFLVDLLTKIIDNLVNIYIYITYFDTACSFVISGCRNGVCVGARKGGKIEERVIVVLI